MTKEQIAELRRLDQEATPAPWHWEEGFKQIVAPVDDPEGRDGEDWDEEAGRFRVKRIVQTDGGCYGPREKDRTLIVTTRNVLGRLLNEREALLNFVKSLDDVLDYEVREVWDDAVELAARVEAP
jgi:hypothetical protein